MYRFLLVGQPNLMNRGCEALTMCSANIIENAVGDCQFEATSNNIDFDSKDMHNWPTCVQFVPMSRRRSLYTIAMGLARRLRLIRPASPHEYWARNIHKYFARTDVVVSIGGDLFSESYGPHQAFETLGHLVYAHRLGKRTVIWAASIGPFHNQELLDYAKETFKTVDLITVRERHTLEYMHSLGIRKNVRLVADPAFILKRRSTERTRLPIFQSKNPLIGIGISDGIYQFSAIGSETKYCQMFAEVADQLVEKYDATICLIPHVIIPGLNGNDDEARCQSVVAKVKRRHRITTFPATHMRAGELKEIMARCDFHIGARTHSTIASLSSSVPTIAIAFSRKAWGIFEDVYGHTNYVMDANSVTVNDILNTFDMLFQNRNIIVETLDKKIPELAKLAEKGGTLLASIL